MSCHSLKKKSFMSLFKKKKFYVQNKKFRTSGWCVINFGVSNLIFNDKRKKK